MFNFLILLEQSGAENKGTKVDIPKEYEEELNRLRSFYELRIKEIKFEWDNTVATYHNDIQSLK